MTYSSLQSYGTDNYTAFACYDFIKPSTGIKITQLGTFQSTSTSSPTTIAINPNKPLLNYGYTSNTNPTQAGALIAFDSSSVTARFGVSFISATHACANAEEEVPDWDWERVREESRSKWEETLERVQVDVEKEDTTVVQLLYSSVG